MRTASFSLAAAALLCTTLNARPGDLSQVQRTIAREPAYQTKSPRYCLLVFGPAAKTRVWLVQDGDFLYVDRNGNGDLTEKGKRIEANRKDKEYRDFQAGDITDGSLTHTGLSVYQLAVSPESVANDKEFARIKGANPQPWTWWVRVAAERPTEDARSLPKRIHYLVNGDGTGYLLFGDRPETAPIIHLNGPWTFALQDVKQRLRVGHASKLQVGVGTMGIGPGTFSWVIYNDTIPADAYPVARFSLPSKQSGSKPIERTVTFKKRC
jgi:hypothetical protein